MDWSQINIRIGTCGRVRCEPGWRLGPDWWKQLRDFDLWLVWAGRGWMRTTERELNLHPGICLWMRPGRCYEATQDPRNRLGVTYLHFTVTDKKGSSMKSCSNIPAEVHEVRDLPFFDAVSRRIVELEQISRSIHSTAVNRTRKHAEDMMALLLRELDWNHGPENEVPASSRHLSPSARSPKLSVIPMCFISRDSSNRKPDTHHSTTADAVPQIPVGTMKDRHPHPPHRHDGRGDGTGILDFRAFALTRCVVSLSLSHSLEVI